MSKRKKQKGPSQPRSDWVYAQIDQLTSSFSVTFNPKGTVRVNEANPASVRVVRSYKREKSGKDDKFVLAVPSCSPDAPLSTSHALDQFHSFIAIDTGTKNIAERTVSVTVAYVLEEYGKSEVIRPLCSFLLLDVTDNMNAEKIGWHLALRNVNPSYFRSGKRLGVVVDSALGEHHDINAKKVGYYEENYLPSFATLIYASDASDDNLPNRMIKLCDAQAKKVLASLNPEVIKRTTVSNGDKNFAGYAVINFKTEPPTTPNP